MREPVLLAKQVATLDHLSGGRVILGVAVRGYRDEFEAVKAMAATAREEVEALRNRLAALETSTSGPATRARTTAGKTSKIATSEIETPEE